MLYLFQLSVVILGFLIGSWYFGLAELFIEDYEVRRRVMINSILITFLFTLYFFLNT